MTKALSEQDDNPDNDYVILPEICLPNLNGSNFFVLKKLETLQLGGKAEPLRLA